MHRNNRKMSAKRHARMQTLARAYQFAYRALREPLPNTGVGPELCRACHAICKEMERTAPSRYYLSGCDMARRSVADIAWLYAGQYEQARGVDNSNKVVDTTITRPVKPD